MKGFEFWRIEREDDGMACPAIVVLRQMRRDGTE